MVLRSGKRKHVAIDYDRQQIRLVLFEYVRKVPAILSMHTAAIPEDVDVSDPFALGRFLKTVVDKLSLRGARALMCVGRAQAVLKSLTLPPVINADELASMVQFQVAQALPYGADEAVVDFTHGAHWDAKQTDSTEAGAEGTTVLAASVRLPVLDAANHICEEAGLKLERLGLRPYANLRALFRCVRSQPDERIVFVNVTADEAEIDVMCDETLEFSRAVALSAPGANGATVAEDQSDPSAQVVRRVVTEVALSLQSFHAVQRGQQIHGCLVAGATGLEAQLAAALTKRLGVRCELFDPSAGFALAGGPQVSAFGAALGLAAGQAADALPFDFLNPKRPSPPKDTRKIRAAAVIAAVVALIAAAVIVRSAYLSKRRDTIKSLASENEKLAKDNKQLKKLAGRVKLVQEWAGAQLDWIGQLAHLSNTLPGAENVYLDSIQCKPGRISLGGRAKDRQSISHFASELMAMSGYEVRPGATSSGPDAFGYNLRFGVEVLISPEAKPIIKASRPVGRPANDSAMQGLDRGRSGRRRPSRSGPLRNRGRP